MDVEKIIKEVLEELKKNTSQKGNDIDEHSPDARTFTHDERKIVSVDNPKNLQTIEHARSLTPARIGIGRTGTRMKTKHYLDFRIDHAAAQDAVFKDVDDSVLKELNLPELRSRAKDQEEYLMNLDAGRKLDKASAEWLTTHSEKDKQVQIVVSDGLSSTGVEETIPDLLPALIQGLQVKGITFGQPVFIKKSRVWVQDEVATLTNCDVVISLIGERPGLATSKSVSAYLVYRPNEKTVEADRTVFSNIHEGGVPPVEAGAYLADVISEMLRHKASGVRFASRKKE